MIRTFAIARDAPSSDPPGSQPHRKMGALLETREGVPAMPLAVVVAASVASGAVASVALEAACVNSCRLWPPRRRVT